MDLFKKNVNKIIITLICAILLLSSFSFGSSELIENTISVTATQNNDDSPPYKGFIRIFVVEPDSRWTMYDGQSYHFGFLDFALEENLSIPYTETYQTQATWNPEDADYQSSSISEDNIMVIAAVYNQESTKKYAYPPFQNPFQAHYIDATAAAEPGNPGFNVKTEDYTHTGLVEEGTATWCPYCPNMAHALYGVYQDGDLPFYFISLITDKSSEAAQYVTETFNLYAYPSAFMDGGNRVIVGGYDDEEFYKNRLTSVLSRDVHDLNLSVDLVFNQDKSLTISVEISNNEEVANSAPATPVIAGETNGKKGNEYKYSIIAEDEEGNNIYYRVDWGDDDITEWLGPYESGTEIFVNHSWTDRGEYDIRVQAKDIYDAESEWGTLSVSMPLVQSFRYNQLLQKLRDFIYDFIRTLTVKDNTPPNPPDITGPTEGIINEQIRYIMVLTDPDGDQLLRIEVKFGDETVVERCGCDKPWYNGTTINVDHTWRNQGDYSVTARVQDEYSAWSEWTDPIIITIPNAAEQLEQMNMFSVLK